MSNEELSTGRNYKKMWGALSRAAQQGGMELEEFKEYTVGRFTDGRTTHFHEMTETEWRSMSSHFLFCGTSFNKELKTARARVLHQLEVYGVYTDDWGRIDAFCLDKRIAGKKFARLGLTELAALERKMRSINRKRRETPPPAPLPEEGEDYRND